MASRCGHRGGGRGGGASCPRHGPPLRPQGAAAVGGVPRRGGLPPHLPEHRGARGRPPPQDRVPRPGPGPAPPGPRSGLFVPPHPGGGGSKIESHRLALLRLVWRARCHAIRRRPHTDPDNLPRVRFSPTDNHPTAPRRATSTFWTAGSWTKVTRKSPAWDHLFGEGRGKRVTWFQNPPVFPNLMRKVDSPPPPAGP